MTFTDGPRSRPGLEVTAVRDSALVRLGVDATGAEGSADPDGALGRLRDRLAWYPDPVRVCGGGRLVATGAGCR